MAAPARLQTMAEAGGCRTAKIIRLIVGAELHGYGSGVKDREHRAVNLGVKCAATVICTVICIGLIASSVEAAQRKPTPRRPAAKAPTANAYSHFVSNADYLAAFGEVVFCGHKSKEPHPLNCESEWRGIRWSVDHGVAGTIDTGGNQWTFSCKYDAIEDSDSCSFITGQQFMILMPGGHDVFVSWGFRRFPGSEMIARFDNQVPIWTKSNDGWTATQSATIFRRMIGGKIMRYRWSDWPEENDHDGTIDLTNFRDTAALMEAIFSEFQVIRIGGDLELR